MREREMKSITLLLVLCGVGHALEDEPSPAPSAYAVPDATLRAVKDQTVTVCLRNGAALRARIVAFEASTLTVALSLSGSVVTIDRTEVTDVRLPLAIPPPPPPAVSVAAPAPGRQRHFGLQFSGAPGIMLDVDYKLFYGFANFPFVYPATTGGGLLPMSFGLGVNFPVARGSRWKMEVYGFVAPLRIELDGGEDDGGPSNPWSVAIGVGIGVHYTFPSGFSLGLKSPVLGWATNAGSIGNAMAAFYLSSAMGLPLLSMGYRF
jgi:hypothetical protein